MFEPRRPSPSGYTLVELIVAMASSMLLLAGMGGSIFIAAKAFDEGDSQTFTAVAAGNVADDIMAEMQYATRFYERTPYAVTFNIPDRDGDGSEEKFRYAWSGVAGAPLTKQLNGSAATVLVDRVQNLNFTYLTRTLPALPPPVVSNVVVFQEFIGKNQNVDGTDLTIDLPKNTAAGNLLIAAVVTDGNNYPKVVAPAGWNLIVVEERYSEVTFAVWWKLASSSEPKSHTFEWKNAEQAYGWIMRFTGHSPANPINAWSVLTTGSGVTLNPPSPAVTSTVANTMILRLGGFDDDDINDGNPGLSGHTAINMQLSNTGTGTCSGGSGYVTQASPGNSGQSTFTHTDMEQTVAVTIAIAPAP